MELRRGRKNVAQQCALAASHVHQSLEAREVVSGEQRGGGPRDALGHDSIEYRGVSRMGDEVIKKGLPEDSLERRRAGADRFVKLSERAPEKRCRQKQGSIPLRVGMISAQHFRERRVAETTIWSGLEHSQSAQCAQETFE